MIRNPPEPSRGPRRPSKRGTLSLVGIAAAVGAALILGWWPDSRPDRSLIRPAVRTVAPPGVVAESPAPPRAAIEEPAAPEADSPFRQAPTVLQVSVRCETDPIAGAPVRVHAGDRVVPLVTDSQGIATWSEAIPGEVTIRSARGAERSTRIEPHTLNRVELSLPRGVEVWGRVLDDVGDPVAGATVFLARPVTVLQKLDPIAVTDADEDGRFRIPAVPSNAKLAARARGHRPSTLHAVILERIPGPRWELTLVVPRGGGGLRGVVVGPGGEPVADAEVELDGGIARLAPARAGQPMCFTWPTHRTRTDPGGRFAILGQHPGRCDVVVRSAGFAPLRQPVEITPGSDAEIRLTLAPGASLAGRVTGEDGRPIAGVAIDRAARDGAWFRGAVPVKTGRDGRYRFDGLAPGELQVFVSKQGYAQVLERVVVAPGEPTRFDVVLTEHPRVRGRVVRPDGSPLTAIQVTARGVEAGPPTLLWVVTGEDGGFEMALPADRSFKLYLRWHQRGIETDAGLEPIRGPRSDLLIVVDETREATARIVGRVAGVDGRPVAGAWLQLRAPGVLGQRQQLRHGGYADPSDGAFSLGPLVPGKYWVLVHSPQAAFAPVEFGPFELAPRGSLDAGTLALRGGTLRLRPSFARGDPPEQGIRGTIYDAKTELTVVNFAFDLHRPTAVALPPGSYRVTCLVPGFTAFRSGVIDVVEGADIEVEAAFEPVGKRR